MWPFYPWLVQDSAVQPHKALISSPFLMPSSPNQNALGKKKKSALSAVPGRKLAQHSSENLPQRKPAAKPGVEQTFLALSQSQMSACQQHTQMASYLNFCLFVPCVSLLSSMVSCSYSHTFFLRNHHLPCNLLISLFQAHFCCSIFPHN